jgi:hypothetical protein
LRLHTCKEVEFSSHFTTDPPNGGEESSPDQRLRWLEERVRYLEGRLAAHEPMAALKIAELLRGPQRCLPSGEIEQQTRRLLAVVIEQGVMAVVPEVCTCRALLLSLAAACHQARLTSAGQYLDYLATPYT